MRCVFQALCFALAIGLPLTASAEDGRLSAGPMLGVPLGIGVAVEAVPSTGLRFQGTVGTSLMLTSAGMRALLFPGVVDGSCLFVGGGRYVFIVPDVLDFGNYLCIGVGSRGGHGNSSKFFEVGIVREPDKNYNTLTVSVGLLYGGR
jgi:hypothetical protein